MQFDFDVAIPREGSNSVKWEFVTEQGRTRHWHDTAESRGNDRVLPMWVADMDFKCAPPIVQAIQNRAEHGIFGYSEKTETYLEAVVDWMRDRHDWSINSDWIVTCPGVVPALHFAVRAFVEPGEKVLVQGPVYYPFYNAIRNNGATIVSNSLVASNGRYEMDLDDLSGKLKDPAVKLAILCNPHNPVGRVWTALELRQFGELCEEHGVTVVADEIHADLTFPETKFTPYASLGDAFATHSLTTTAASKAFNLAGLHESNIIISNPRLREAFVREQYRVGLYGMNPFGIVATEAAYREGLPWLLEVVEYLKGNRDFIMDFMAAELPEIVPYRPEGTYLFWFDCRALGLDKHALGELVRKKAKLYLDDGHIFGVEGDGFERLNFACTRELLTEALQRLKQAVSDL